MITTRFRALQFVHPDVVVDGTAGQAGLQLAPQGGLSTVTGSEAVHQALLLLLTTRPGERVGRPAYGCELFRLVFSPVDETTAGLAIHYVRQAVTRWEPRVQVVNVDATPESGTLPAGAALEVRLTYRVTVTGQTDVLALSVPLAQGQP